jgi:hypothetical protein
MSQGYHQVDSTRPQATLSPPLSDNDLPSKHSLDDLRPGQIGRHGRSDTVTSLGGFDFREAVLPLTLSGEEEHGAKGDEKHVGLLHGQLSN